MEIGDLEPKTEAGKVNRWQGRIDMAVRYRDSFHNSMGVPRYIKQYLGDYDVKLSGMKAPPINDVYSYIQASIAGLFVKNPFITINPKKTGTILGSYLVESAVNYFIRELDTKEEVEKEIVDALLTGDGFHKVGINVRTQGNGETLKLLSEKIYSTRVSWKDLVFSIGTRDIGKDCSWMAQRIVRPMDQIKKLFPGNPGFKGGPHPGLTESEIKGASHKPDINFGVMWEIHDAENKEILLIGEGYDKFLKKSKWPDYMDEFPFQNLWFNYIPDEPYHMSDIKPWEPQVLEKIKLLAMILNHVKRWSRQLLVQEGAIKPNQMAKLEQGVDGAMIMTTKPPAEAAQVLSYAPMPPEVFQLINILNQIAQEVNGMPSVDKGAPQVTKSRTLGELEFMQAGAKGRTDRKIQRIERHYKNIARHIIAHMQGNFDLEQVVKITGEPPDAILQAFGQRYDPVSHTVSFTKDDIQGEYEAEVVAGSSLNMDKETKQQILSMILDKSAALASAPMIPPFVEAVIEEMLRGYDIESLKVAFQDQKKMQEQTMQQQAVVKQVETDKVQAEADKRKAQASQIRTDTAIKGAETLHKAHLHGVLPEAIEMGRGMGILPGGEEPQGGGDNGM